MRRRRSRDLRSKGDERPCQYIGNDQVERRAATDSVVIKTIAGQQFDGARHLSRCYAVYAGIFCADLNRDGVNIAGDYSSGWPQAARCKGQQAGSCADINDITILLAQLFQRSEEHTSELQSRENFICRLL